MDVFDFDISKEQTPLRGFVVSLFKYARKELDEFGRGENGTWNEEGLTLSDLYKFVGRARYSSEDLNKIQECVTDTADRYVSASSTASKIDDIDVYLEAGVVKIKFRIHTYDGESEIGIVAI